MLTTPTPGIQPTVSITQEQIAFFHENGFLAIEAITSPEEIARLREIYDRLFASQSGRETGDQFDLGGADEDGKIPALPQILGPAKYAPELENTLYRANALAISRQLLGQDVTFVGDHAIFKPAHYGAPTPWHQDEAYWDSSLEYNRLSVWMPLQEANLENGCLQFIPSSQNWDILEHQSIGGDTRIHGLEILDGFDASAAVACPLPAGGATFHLNRTLHYASPNNSDIPRRAYILGFETPPKPIANSRTFPWIERRSTAREQRAAQARTA